MSADRRRLVAYGAVKLYFAFLGTKERPLDAPRPGPSATGEFLPIPGQRVAPGTPGPSLVEGSEAIGVYAARGVSFDEAGFWEVTSPFPTPSCTRPQWQPPSPPGGR